MECQDTNVRPPSLLDTTILKIDPLARWWSNGDIACVALRSPQQVPVLSLVGAGDSHAAPPLRQALGAALRARPTHIVIDLAAVSQPGAPTVPLLEAARRTAAWHGAELWLAAVPTVLRDLLHQAGIAEFFPTSRTPARAIEEMNRPARMRRTA